jgi:hypothetical protein
MKKMMPLLLFWIFFLFLSSAWAVEPTVTGNNFQSDQPKLNIKIAEEFKYLDKISYKSNIKSMTPGSKRKTENDFYIFVSEGPARQIKKVLFIHFRKIDTYWVDRTADLKSNLDYNLMDLQGYHFRYYKRIEKAGAVAPVAKYLTDAGYAVPPCLLRNGSYIIPNKDLWVTINYWEDAALSQMSCDRPYSQDALSAEQKGYLGDFHKRAMAAIGMGETATAQPAGVALPYKSKPAEVIALKPAPKREEAKPVSAAVFHFTPLNMDAAPYGLTATNTMINSLKMQPSFVMLDRRDLETFLFANDLQQNDRTENMVHIGARMGLNAVIAGSVEKKGSMIITTCKAVSVEQKKVIFTQRSISAGESDLVGGIQKMAAALVESIQRSRAETD